MSNTFPPLTSRIRRAAPSTNARLPHPSWRGPTMAAQAEAASIRTATDFWSRLGL
ncbi:hypothetical protein [Novosphingobium sp. Leaf2]|uniref:hypothetical protein n=1 Tax=Novosphingobium sp. Leaf2 TaxID=1735670 RepID=UPI000AC1760A|nr:hypothetical protein [Novosphingobium sp. Leaf2]